MVYRHSSVVRKNRKIRKINFSYVSEYLLVKKKTALFEGGVCISLTRAGPSTGHLKPQEICPPPISHSDRNHLDRNTSPTFIFSTHTDTNRAAIVSLFAKKTFATLGQMPSRYLPPLQKSSPIFIFLESSKTKKKYSRNILKVLFKKNTVFTSSFTSNNNIY